MKRLKDVDISKNERDNFNKYGMKSKLKLSVGIWVNRVFHCFERTQVWTTCFVSKKDRMSWRIQSGKRLILSTSSFWYIDMRLKQCFWLCNFVGRVLWTGHCYIEMLKQCFWFCNFGICEVINYYKLGLGKHGSGNEKAWFKPRPFN